MIRFIKNVSNISVSIIRLSPYNKIVFAAKYEFLLSKYRNLRDVLNSWVRGIVVYPRNIRAFVYED